MHQEVHSFFPAIWIYNLEACMSKRKIVMIIWFHKKTTGIWLLTSIKFVFGFLSTLLQSSRAALKQTLRTFFYISHKWNKQFHPWKQLALWTRMACEWLDNMQNIPWDYVSLLGQICPANLPAKKSITVIILLQFKYNEKNQHWVGSWMIKEKTKWIDFLLVHNLWIKLFWNLFQPS